MFRKPPVLFMLMRTPDTDIMLPVVREGRVERADRLVSSSIGTGQPWQWPKL
jgi:hypothetical protein